MLHYLKHFFELNVIIYDFMTGSTQLCYRNVEIKLSSGQNVEITYFGVQMRLISKN